MRSRFRKLVLIALLGSSIAACAGEPPEQPNNDVRIAPTIVRDPPALTRIARQMGGFVSSVDAEGVPQFIWAIDQKAAPGTMETARAAAEYHLRRYAAALDLRSTDLDTAELRILRDMGDGGWLAKWKQKYGGIEVYPSEVSVLMRKNFDLVVISGRLRQVNDGKQTFELSQEAALALALEAHLGIMMSPESFVRKDEQRFSLAGGVPIQMTDARVKPIYYARKRTLEPAWFVEFYAGHLESVDTDAYRYILSAVDGRIIQRRNLQANEAFMYRVWVDEEGRPLDGPIADPTPHPTGMPDGSIPALIPPRLISMDGFNKMGDPWLPANATESVGNNVDAYSDHSPPDGFSNADFRATTTGMRAFDRAFDPTIDPIASENQIMASVAELFYVTNWLHDWWYDSGFDEAAGNAQRNNFDRGGEGGDPLRAEAQDGVLIGNRNNANMSTPSDGLSPRMQMYSWTNASARITLTPGGEVGAGTASFGPTNFDVTAEVVRAIGAVDTSTDGCSAYANDVSNRIALVDRGVCTFVEKAAVAQAAGARALLVANNASGPPPGLGGTDPSITIPVLSMSQADGIALRNALRSGTTVTARLFREVGPDRDGSLDHTVIAHEWGHYFHHRLTDCGNPQCAAMSEGWGDWVSLFMAIREGDDLDGAFPTGVWATLSGRDASFFGIRRVAYSTDFSRNALTLRHISDAESLPTSAPISPGGPNSEVHNAGEIWATMLHDAYVALLRAHTSTAANSFRTTQRLMGDYIVAGLQLTPRDATYTEARDAILAAAYARDPNDMMIFANAFARRGAGSCAIAPARDSEDFVGVVESYDLGSSISIGSIVFDESLRSCDQDGILDADERGRVVVNVGNAGPQMLSGATITVSSTSAGVRFPAGPTIALADLAPFSATEVELEVALDGNLTGMSSMVLAVRLDGPGSCQMSTTSTVIARVNFDEVGGAKEDDVESSGSPWTATGPQAEEIWARTQVAAFDHAWIGVDFGEPSDTALESPPLEVSTSTGVSFVMSFEHRFRFEFSRNTYWDGGVIEISRDGGTTWTDIADLGVDPRYVGELTDESGNPLALRRAYASTSTAWPNRTRMTFDFGDQFAGETIRVRFRIGTDAAAGDYGWEIDNLRFEGITNAPFERLAQDAAECPPDLVANAGEDQTVDPAQIVELSGSGMSFEGLPITFAWQQTAGPTVQLTRADTANPRFISPVQEVESVLTFELTVSDGVRTATDSVDITVRPTAPAVVTANAGPDQTVDANALVVLDGSASTTSGTLPLTHSWRQIGGTTVSLDHPNSVVARFTAPAPATNEVLTFELTVSDGLHASTDRVEITVNGYLLTANAGEDQIVESGALVVLDGSQSSSSTNLPLTFSWSQTAGPAVTLENATNVVARFTAPNVVSDTVLTFELSVSDGSLTSISTVDITVQAAEVQADAGDDQTVGPNTRVFLDGSGSLGKNLTYSWTQTAGPRITLENANGVAPSFMTGAPRQLTMLTFELTVSDGVASSSDSVTITVRPVEEDEGCDCTATHTGGTSSALFMLLLAGASLLLRKRR